MMAPAPGTSPSTVATGAAATAGMPVQDDRPVQITTG